jgi:hypothetical protein
MSRVKSVLRVSIVIAVLLYCIDEERCLHGRCETPAVLNALVVQSNAVKYPLYEQCHSIWASLVMGGDGHTICDVGCLVCSIAMAMHGFHITIEGAESNPQTLNHWLQLHHGYTENRSDLIEENMDSLHPGYFKWPNDGMHVTNDLPLTVIAEYMTRPVPRVVIAHVEDGHHFVLCTGVDIDNNRVKVNDPWKSHTKRDFYNYTEVVGWRLFDMKPMRGVAIGKRKARQTKSQAMILGQLKV